MDNPPGQWHALVYYYGHHPLASGTLQSTVMVIASSQWHALMACYDYHHHQWKKGARSADGGADKKRSAS